MWLVPVNLLPTATASHSSSEPGPRAPWVGGVTLVKMGCHSGVRATSSITEDTFFASALTTSDLCTVCTGGCTMVDIVLPPLQDESSTERFFCTSCKQQPFPLLNRLSLRASRRLIPTRHC